MARKPQTPSIWQKARRWFFGKPQAPQLKIPQQPVSPPPIEMFGGEEGFQREEYEQNMQAGLGEGGFRGAALGDRNNPDVSKTNREKWRTLSAEIVEDFLEDQQPVFVHSTNVEMAQYFPQDRTLIVKFKDKMGKNGKFYQGYPYAYSPVSKELARSLMRALSKGIWVWDHLRVRGSQTAHQVGYHRLAGHIPFALPAEGE